MRNESRWVRIAVESDVSRLMDRILRNMEEKLSGSLVKASVFSQQWQYPVEGSFLPQTGSLSRLLTVDISAISRTW